MLIQFLSFLLSEGWMSPAIAMVAVTIDPKYKGVAMAVFLGATAMAGSLGIFLVGKIKVESGIESQ